MSMIVLRWWIIENVAHMRKLIYADDVMPAFTPVISSTIGPIHDYAVTSLSNQRGFRYNRQCF